MLFTSITLPEDAHLISGRGERRAGDGARVDARPPAPRRRSDVRLHR
jgi:hypothetical protein